MRPSAGLHRLTKPGKFVAVAQAERWAWDPACVLGSGAPSSAQFKSRNLNLSGQIWDNIDDLFTPYNQQSISKGTGFSTILRFLDFWPK